MFTLGTTTAAPSSSLTPVDSSLRRLPPDLVLFLCAIFCLSVQIQLPGSSETFETRIAPSDLFLALTLVVCPSLLRIRRRTIDLLPLAMLITLAIGVLIALVRVGNVTTHSLLVKFGGGLVLALLAIVTASYVRDGWTDQILRTFIVGMAFWSVVAYLDWKVVDLLPFVEAKTPTRFGGMQFDPNNAGVGYGA